MSAGTLPSSSSGGTDTQSGTGLIDESIYIYLMPEQERINVCYYLNDVWKDVAKQMGYTQNDLIRITKMAQDKRIDPADQLLSLWGDQNHTVAELFMILYRQGQYPAMECLKNLVPKNYHRLLLHGLPNLQILLGKRSELLSKLMPNMPSLKILNGPAMSRDTNESELNTDSMPSCSGTLNEEKIHEVAKAIPRISYKELSDATNNWSDDLILGRGGFGTVYKGRWKHTDVAIKKIVYHGAAKEAKNHGAPEDVKNQAKIQLEQSFNELHHLNSCRHDNILALYGYSLDTTPGAEACVVYQFMSGGSLERRLHVRSGDIPLSFQQRQRVIKGTACGLQYLHTYINGKPLIHGDIKPGNILLDPCCHPKIGDFGLVREGSLESMEVSSIYGTRPYLPIEFLTKRSLSTKIDTFSYGVVLFEVLTAKRAYDKSRGQANAFLTKFMWSMHQTNRQMFEFVDKNMVSTTVSPDLYDILIKIALECTEENADNRPEMVHVYNKLAPLIQVKDTDLLKNE